MLESSSKVKYTAQDPDELAAIKKLPFSYRLVSWGPITAVVMTLIFFFVSQVIAVIVLIVGAITLDGQTTDSLQVANGPLSTTTYQFIGSVLVTVVLMLLIYAFLRYKKTSIKALG